MNRATLASAVLFAALAFFSPSQAQPVDSSREAAGRGVYQRECASCHGSAGTGYGPASWLLKQRPPDLTLFRNRTTPFPRAMIANIITGHIRLVPSHWASEMPKWRSMPDLDSLLDYLESMQARPYGPYKGATAQELAAAGSELFQVHCTACHGESGSRKPSATYVVGIGAPDLTTLRARRGPVTMQQLIELIARCDGEVDDPMPSWQRAFERQGWQPYVGRANIDRLAHYLDSIQQK